MTGDVPLVLEVPRGPDQERALDDIAAEAGDGGRVVAKFRTGATPAWDWPDEQELAAFLVGAAERGLPFKLTGGLHHAVRGTHTVHGQREEQHGLLNVLVACRGRRRRRRPRTASRRCWPGATPRHWCARSRRLADARTSPACARLFTSYGCCGVTDPVARAVRPATSSTETCS